MGTLACWVLAPPFSPRASSCKHRLMFCCIIATALRCGASAATAAASTTTVVKPARAGTGGTGNCSDVRRYPPTHKSKSNPCDDFCTGRCSFCPTPPVELELIRMTPVGVDGIANKDTGDDAGDLYFTLLSVTKATECSKPNPAPWAGCFLAGENHFIKNRVHVDGKWGIYQECNPATAPLTPEQQNSGDFACCDGLSCSSKPSPWAPKHVNSSDYCFCDRTNHTVGRSTVVAHFGGMSKYGPAYLSETANLIGGNWYSTPAAGQCSSAQQPGDSSGCTWKIVEQLTKINQTCVRNHVWGAVEANCPLIFRSCPQPYNRSAECYANVFFDAFLGNSTFNCPRMTKADLLAPWKTAFSGGCPPVI